MLLEAEADIEQSDVGGWTPLFWAVYKDRHLVVQKLIEYQAEVNVVDEVGLDFLSVYAYFLLSTVSASFSVRHDAPVLGGWPRLYRNRPRLAASRRPGQRSR